MPLALEHYYFNSMLHIYVRYIRQNNLQQTVLLVILLVTVTVYSLFLGVVNCLTFDQFIIIMRDIRPRTL